MYNKHSHWPVWKWSLINLCLHHNVKISITKQIETYKLSYYTLNLHKSSLWTPHIQHTPSLNCYRLVDATELWAPERPDTETVSSLRQSTSWTLDINVEHTTLLYIIYSPNILIFSFQFCTYQTCTHIIVYIIYCVFAILYILFVYYSFIICVLSCCCHSVALWSFCHDNKFLVCVNIPGQ